MCIFSFHLLLMPIRLLFKKMQRHTVIYTDEYEMTEEEFKKSYNSKDEFLKKVECEDIEEYKVNLL